jgi:hypothetical protein
LKRLKELEDFIRVHGSTPVCVYAPTVGGFTLDRLRKEGKIDGQSFDTQFFVELVQKHCDSERIQLINLEPMLQQKYDKGEKLNFDLDSHFNQPTSKAIGEYLYRALKPAPKAPKT